MYVFKAGTVTTARVVGGKGGWGDLWQEAASLLATQPLTTLTAVNVFSGIARLTVHFIRR